MSTQSMFAVITVQLCTSLLLLSPECRAQYQSQTEPEAATVRSRYSTAFYYLLNGDVTSDLGVRNAHVSSQLGLMRGYAAQKLRLLLWATEPDSEYRKEIFTQWLIDETQTPSKDALKEQLRDLLRRQIDSAISTRFREIEEIYEKVSLKANRERREERFGKFYPDGQVETPLDMVTNEMLFSTDADIRLNAYRNMPRFNGYGLEEPYWVQANVFNLLWMLEPDERSCQVLMERSMNAFGAPSVSGARFEPFLAEFRPEEKAKLLGQSLGEGVTSQNSTPAARSEAPRTNEPQTVAPPPTDEAPLPISPTTTEEAQSSPERQAPTSTATPEPPQSNTNVFVVALLGLAIVIAIVFVARR